MRHLPLSNYRLINRYKKCRTCSTSDESPQTFENVFYKTLNVWEVWEMARQVRHFDILPSILPSIFRAP